jgi:hypothetical protein
MKIDKILLFLFTFTLFSLSVKAEAFCACCAEDGEYSISVLKPDSFYLGVLEEIQFATANLYTNAGSPENILGISPLADNYSVKGLFQNKAWKFNITDDKGKNGTLLLPMPTTMVSFMVDLHQHEPGQTAGPVLYKELRFKYKVRQGTGIFQKGMTPATEYFLVLQGRGNNCPSSTDFSHWRLEVTGKKASYAFYGNLKTTE